MQNTGWSRTQCLGIKCSLICMSLTPYLLSQALPSRLSVKTLSQDLVSSSTLKLCSQALLSSSALKLYTQALYSSSTLKLYSQDLLSRSSLKLLFNDLHLPTDRSLFSNPSNKTHHATSIHHLGHRVPCRDQN